MAFHAKYSLGRPGIAQVLNPLLAVPTLEALRAKGLITRQDGQIFDLVPAGATAIRAIAANQ